MLHELWSVGRNIILNLCYVYSNLFRWCSLSSFLKWICSLRHKPFAFLFLLSHFSSFPSWNPIEKPMCFSTSTPLFCQNEETMLINFYSHFGFFKTLEGFWKDKCSIVFNSGFFFQLECKSRGFRSRYVLELKANQRIAPFTHQLCSLSPNVLIQRNWIFQQSFLHLVLLSVNHYMDIKSELIK